MSVAGHAGLLGADQDQSHAAEIFSRDVEREVRVLLERLV